VIQSGREGGKGMDAFFKLMAAGPLPQVSIRKGT